MAKQKIGRGGIALKDDFNARIAIADAMEDALADAESASNVEVLADEELMEEIVV